MTYEYECNGGPNDKQRYQSEQKILAIRLEGGEYVSTVQFTAENMDKQNASYVKNVMVLDWTPEAS